MWRQPELMGSLDPSADLGGWGALTKVEEDSWNSWMLSVTAPDGPWGLEVWFLAFQMDL